MPQDPNLPTNRLQERQVALREKMAAQSPFHESLANTFERLGGEDHLLTWAEENPTQFYSLMMKASPAPIQTPKGGGLSLTLALHPSLAPGPLDITPEHTPVTVEHDAG
jgi:hypothetical protein